jgi:hypothetical protein
MTVITVIGNSFPYFQINQYDRWQEAKANQYLNIVHN